MCCSLDNTLTHTSAHSTVSTTTRTTQCTHTPATRACREPQNEIVRTHSHSLEYFSACGRCDNIPWRLDTGVQGRILTRGRQHAENGLLHNTHVTQCGMRMGSEGLVRGSHSGRSPARSRVAREQQRKAASCCATADGLLKTAAVIAPSWQPPSSAQFRILRPHPSSARR